MALSAATAPNFGILNGLADGLKSGLIGYQNMQNIQHQNQMQELMTGVRKNPDTGNLEYTPEKALQMKAQGASAQNTLDELDPNTDASQKMAGARGGLLMQGNPKITSNPYEGLSGAQQKEIDPLAKTDMSAQLGLIKAMTMAQINPTADIKRRALGVQEHELATKGVNNNPVTQKLLDSQQSMQNALVEFKNNPSPQSFHTLQNVARMNAGSSNRSGVDERSSQYATDLGITKDEASQIITGNMQDVNLSSPNMVNAIMKVMDGEIKQKQVQAAQQIGKNKKSQEILYNNPESEKYKPAFDSAVKDQYAQFGLDENGNPMQDASPAAGGLIQPPAQDQAAKLKRLQDLKAKAGMK